MAMRASPSIRHCANGCGRRQAADQRDRRVGQGGLHALREAFMRSDLWKPESWIDRSELPTLGEILRTSWRLPIRPRRPTAGWTTPMKSRCRDKR